MTVKGISFFPYSSTRPEQDRAIHFAEGVFSHGKVGLLSADCGVGKTIAVLSGYISARNSDELSRLIILTRTHSQSKAFEDELTILRGVNTSGFLTATSMVSRIHVCPIKHRITMHSTQGFLRGCAAKIKSNECTQFWNCYRRSSDGVQVREHFVETVRELVEGGVVTRQVAEDVGRENDLCPYEILRWCARSSRVVIGPYSYLFKHRVRDALLKSLNVELGEIDIIVDEAHNLAEHVLDAESAQLSGRDVLWLRDNLGRLKNEITGEWLSDTVSFFKDFMMEMLDRRDLQGSGEIEIQAYDVYPRFVDKDTLSLLQSELYTNETGEDYTTETPLDRLVEFLFVGHRASQSNDYHCTMRLTKKYSDVIEFGDTSLQIRPLNAAGLTAPVLRLSRSAILMSGTLRPLTFYSKILGVADAITLDLASPYPRDSRMILLDKEFTTKYTERSTELWRSISKRISVALETVPADKSALIAFPSYSMMRDVLSNEVSLGHRCRIVEEKSTQIEEVKDAVLDSPHAIFCVYGGKLSEGIDLVKNGSSLLNLVIAVGIPFSPPTTYQIALQKWYEDIYARNKKGIGYYYSSVIPAIRRVVQLTGRLRRSPRDNGIVLLLDKRYGRYMSMFGEQAGSELWPFSSVSELKLAVQFYYKKCGRDNCAKH